MAGTALHKRLHSRAAWLATACALAIAGPATGATFTTFDVDGLQAFPAAINAHGTVTGFGWDGDTIIEGFVRSADGTVTTFAAPGSNAIILPTAISDKGAITGYYDCDAYAGYDSGCVVIRTSAENHGFLRKQGGKLITFDPKGSADTEPHAINDGGVITGSYAVTFGSYNTHGFVRARDGTITTFDLTGSTGTEPMAINANGDIAGYYSKGKTHSFLRMADGRTTSFDVKNATATRAFAINSGDVIAGYCTLKDETIEGFERAPGGRIKTFVVPGASKTMPVGINDKGQIAGTYYDSQGFSHGFVGAPKTGFTGFDVPGGNDTEVFGINNKGAITGNYYDGPDTYGFIRTP